jgi:Polyketide cyclase / dehydrase and lipid transport
MTSRSDTESVERLIPAPAEPIFALLSDANRHHDIDGSGSVLGTKDTPDPLSLGSTFGMSMRLGIGYSTVSTVIEFEPNTRIAWQTQAPRLARLLIGGRIWRYELEPADGGTLVRETWDISKERNKRLVEPMRARTITAMAETLERIDALVTT